MLPPDALWSDPTGLVDYYTTHAIPISIRAGDLVASILVSVFGSYATLLLLGRRTSSRGWRNLLLLGLAALCFAVVGIWGMHFVSMISIRLLASPDVVWYLQFSAGFTVMSLFVPLVATFVAFWFADTDSMGEIQPWRSIPTGIFMGLTISLMHYSASFKLPYLMVSYKTVTVVFAILLACAAATTALFAFFTFRAHWQDSFWKRVICALFLAAAVCGMHYLGLGGTSYMARPNTDPMVLAGAREQAIRLTISISVTCGIIIVFSLSAALVDYLTRRKIRRQARHITIASLAFDQYGKMFVKSDGTLPMQMIQTDADLKSVLAELDPRQSTFQWMYTMTFNWHILKPFVPRIFANIHRKEKRELERALDPLDSFRCRFIEATVLLAQQLNLSVESLGILFDRVMTTGTKITAPEDKGKITPDEDGSIHGISLRLHASEGVVLFLCREVGSGMPAAHDYPETYQAPTESNDTADAMLQRGWRLTDTKFYSRTLSEQLGVPKPEMDIFLAACRTYAKRGNKPVVQTRGTYLGMFGVRPHPKHGLDILVYNFARHQIPAYRLPDVHYPLTPSMKAWIRECSTCTMGELLLRANEAVHRAETQSNGSGSIQSQEDEALYEFQGSMAVAIESLTTALRSWPQIQDVARVSPEVLELPCSNNDDEIPAQMIVLEIILPAPDILLTPIQSRASGVQAPALNTGRPDSDKPPAPFVYSPWSLFAKSQNTIIKGKLWVEACRVMSGDLNRLYPASHKDIAAEVLNPEEKDFFNPGNPFTEPAVSAPRGLGRNLAVHPPSRRRSSAKSLQSPLELDVEKGFGGSADGDSEEGVSNGKASRPSTAATESGIKKGFSALVNMAKETVVPESQDLEIRTSSGPPIYQAIRAKVDGWYMRSMRTLERDDKNNQLDGYDWQTSSKGP